MDQRRITLVLMKGSRYPEVKLTMLMTQFPLMKLVYRWQRKLEPSVQSLGNITGLKISYKQTDIMFVVRASSSSLIMQVKLCHYLGPALVKGSFHSISWLPMIRYNSTILEAIYVILDGIEEGCMRIYCTRHDDIYRAGTARWISSWLVQYILIQPEIKPSNIIIIIQFEADSTQKYQLFSFTLSMLAYIDVSLQTLTTVINIAYRSRQDQASLCWLTNTFLKNYCCTYVTTIVKHLYIAWLSLYLVISMNYSR